MWISQHAVHAKFHDNWPTVSKLTKGQSSGVPRNLVQGGRGGFQQIQLKTEDRENGDLGAVAL